jgi:hypothetical protein
LLGFAPAELRRAYGEAIMQVFRQMCLAAYQRQGILGVLRLWPYAVWDVGFGVLAEYLVFLTRTYERLLTMSRLRSAEFTTLYATLGFVLAALCFRVIGNDIGGGAHPKGVLAGAMRVGLFVIALTLFSGGLPLVVASIRQALAAKQVGTLLLFAIPILALVVVEGTAQVLKHFILPGLVASRPAATDALPGLAAAALLGWAGLAVLATGASAFAVARGVSRSRLHPQLWRFALLPAVIGVAAMALYLGAVILWGVVVQLQVPAQFTGPSGLLATPTVASWLGVVILMALALAVAAVSVLRGFRARAEASAVTTSAA